MPVLLLENSKPRPGDRVGRERPVELVVVRAQAPLRDLQIAKQLNAMKIGMEVAEIRREVEKRNRFMEEERDLDEMMKLKRDAEERCLNDTRRRLLDFVRGNPSATYRQWIEAIHPENAHEGALLEGVDKTIDHRFYVEESDHRRLWNENLTTFLDDDGARRGGRCWKGVRAARARQTNGARTSFRGGDLLLLKYHKDKV